MVGIHIEYGLPMTVVSPSGSPLPNGAFGSLERTVLPPLVMRTTGMFGNWLRLYSPVYGKCSCIISDVHQYLSVPKSGDLQFKHAATPSGCRLNKFVRRLHNMLTTERDGGVVEWRRGLLILHSIDDFTNIVLPKYFITRNFKTFRRQLNYYGFVHLRSFVVGESKTTALWVNQELADHGSDDISSVLMLRRVEPAETTKTPKERRDRKNEAASSVEAEGIIRKSFSFVPAAKPHTMQPSPQNLPAVKIPLPVPQVVHFSHDQSPRWLRSDSLCSDDTPSSMSQESNKDTHTEEYVDFSNTNDYTAASMLLGLSRSAI